MSSDEEVRRLADDLDAAWQDLDLDAVLALHHPASSFEVVGHSPVFHGREEIRLAFAAMLDDNLDTWFERRNLVVTPLALVLEHYMYVDGAADGIFVRPVVDVCSVRDGLVDVKRSYLAPAVATTSAPPSPRRPRGPQRPPV